MRWILFLLVMMGQAASAARAESTKPMLLRVTQISAGGVAINTPRETQCPADGCTMAGELKLSSGTVSFNTVVTFVADGAYVALTALPAGAARIYEFTQARPAPIFLPSGSKSSGPTVLRLTVDRSNGRTALFSTGEPDAYLRVELASSPAPAG